MNCWSCNKPVCESESFRFGDVVICLECDDQIKRNSLAIRRGLTSCDRWYQEWRKGKHPESGIQTTPKDDQCS